MKKKHFVLVTVFVIVN